MAENERISYEIDVIPNHISYDIFDGFVFFSYSFLNIPQSIPLDVEFDREMLWFQHGNCDVNEGMIYISLNPSLNLKDLSCTFFHEMVHAKQILEGDLVFGLSGTPTTWKGECYSCEYETLPWEIEAFTVEAEMMKLFWNE